MKLLYVDESGCTGVLPAATSNIQPVFILAGLLIDQSSLAPITSAYLSLKRRFFPKAASVCRHDLDLILYENKGGENRRIFRAGTANQKRRISWLTREILALLEQNNVRILGRVWIKGIGADFRGREIYTFSIQDLARHFQQYLESCDDQGVMILDGRAPALNTLVSHSIFTAKFKAAGDESPRLIEMPLFGNSKNHAGIQLADFICSGVLFPMAASSYCLGSMSNIHVHRYPEINEFRETIKRLQFRYQHPVSADWTGGVIVSDALSHRSGSALFLPS